VNSYVHQERMYQFYLFLRLDERCIGLDQAFKAL
jgi:hypothetical protein